MTYALLAGAFYTTYRPRPGACGPDGSCARPRTKRLGRTTLWIATVVVILTTAFPWYAQYLPL